MAHTVTTEGLSLENPLLGVYDAFYCSLLVLKMMFMSNLTSITRVRPKAFISPEDTVKFKGKLREEEKVERVRRAHLNDLENIPIFFVVSLIYILTNPSYSFAATLFRAYTLARFVHTFVYAVVVIPQPSRFIAFFVGHLITAYMALKCVCYFLI